MLMFRSAPNARHSNNNSECAQSARALSAALLLCLFSPPKLSLRYCTFVCPLDLVCGHRPTAQLARLTFIPSQSLFKSPLVAALCARRYVTFERRLRQRQREKTLISRRRPPLCNNCSPARSLTRAPLATTGHQRRSAAQQQTANPSAALPLQLSQLHGRRPLSFARF